MGTQTACKPNISALKRVNSNVFRLNFFALFEIFWVYMSANLMDDSSYSLLAHDVTTCH